jgi:hypothetical protein
MKKRINEIKRMQQLVGVINENAMGADWDMLADAIEATIRVEGGSIEVVQQIKDLVDGVYEDMKNDRPEPEYRRTSNL